MPANKVGQLLKSGRISEINHLLIHGSTKSATHSELCLNTKSTKKVKKVTFGSVIAAAVEYK